MNAIEDPLEQKWRDKLNYARTRPAACVGDQPTAHRFAISQTLGLVWRAKAFHSPVSATVHLSPTQYIILCQAGELLEPIEKLYVWDNKFLITDGWSQINAHLRQENALGTLDLDQGLPDWKQSFSGASGPTLDSPTYPALLANWFAVAYKTSSGFWCQTFENGWPTTKPYLVKKSSPIGFVTAAELSPEWFTGLPFTEDDVNRLSKLPYVNTIWHSKDKLEKASQITTELEKWL